MGQQVPAVSSMIHPTLARVSPILQLMILKLESVEIANFDNTAIELIEIFVQ